MNDLAILEDAPVFQSIHTRTDERRENRKAIAARLRKSPCAKRPYSRKQALTARALHVSRGDARFLRTYRCSRCDHWHFDPQGTASPTCMNYAQNVDAYLRQGLWREALKATIWNYEHRNEIIWPDYARGAH